MIYLISRQTQLFKSNSFTPIELSKGLGLFDSNKYIQVDSETMGLDCHTKSLLTLQIGTKENQLVIDWTTISESDKKQIKTFLESNTKIFIFHNAQFDLTFLYKQNIWPKNILDTMIIEQLLYLGYPHIIKSSLWIELDLKLPCYEFDGKDYVLSYALNSVARRRLNINIDKSVRGTIITSGLTEDVIRYAANDVVWLEDILKSQLIDVEKENLKKAVYIECEFTKVLAYIKYCGVHLDETKWKHKMKHNLSDLQDAEYALNNWVINWSKKNVKVKDGRQYIITTVDDTCDISEKIKERLFRMGYFGVSYNSYAIECPLKFTEINLQGDLFDGFNTEPKCNINWSSSIQVIKLFELLGIDVISYDKKEKKEKKSIDAKQLKPQKEYFDIIPLFLKYQECAKVVSTYGQNWLDAINPETGRIHVEFHQLGTDTARVSSGGGVWKLNLQNLPHDAETRACFTAEKGNSWISIDYQS